ncbi:hypothetical protein [Sphingobacterium detergens]|uniref:hypothetical protein n=1 Tax=Sphingobacterium detergens TaxID=1145106 RepID=UPI003AAF4E79
MDSIFIKVPVSERLPEKSGPIVCVHMDGDLFTTGYVKGLSIGSAVTHWLEEIEIPTYEDTRKARDAYSYSYLDPFRWGWKYGVKHILNVIKGKSNA